MEPRELLATFVVTSPADAGDGSLRAAMAAANNRPGADNIIFSLPAVDTLDQGPAVPGFKRDTQSWILFPQSALPAITDPLTIDGYSQAHVPVSFRYPAQTSPDPIQFSSRPNSATATEGNDAAIRVIVDGSQSGGADGFAIDTSQSVIRGLAITGFRVGVSIPGPQSVGNLIQGNFIGGYYLFAVNPATGEDLTTADRVRFIDRGNSAQGVLLGSRNTTVGGIDTQANNVITANGLEGIAIRPGAEGNQVIGNQVGVAGPTINGKYVIAGNGASGSQTRADGAAIGSDGVLVQASSNYVGGTAPGSGNVISGNAGHGVHLSGPDATRVNVKGNLIGGPPGGGYVFGAGDPGNGGDGVVIEGASGNVIGGPAASDRNVISANEGAGLRVLDQANPAPGGPAFAASGNVATGNVIGLTRDGVSALGNALDGVVITSAGNVVGPGNVISANSRGIYLDGPGAANNQVIDNLIGTNLAGDADLGNANEGIRIEGASGNAIRGNARGSQVISGNQVGVLILGPGASGNRLTGSFVGTDITGTFDLGNAQEGVRVEEAAGNIIGGPTPSLRNLISANHWGVVLTGPSATGNAVQGNFIGTDLTGSAPLGNGNELDGVFIRAGASDNAVGGPSVEAGNTIAFNVRDGVRVEGPSVRNAILTNRIFTNGALGIDLVVASDPPSGVTPNPVESGPNNLQNYPEQLVVASSVDFTNIRGILDSAANTTYVIQFFSNATADGSGFGEGQNYLGQTTATTDRSGRASFSADVPVPVLVGQSVTATATDPTGNTSEFSANASEIPGMVQFQMSDFVVNEAAGTATVFVTRSGGSGGRFTVDYATSGGTARPGVDYEATSGTLTFEAGVDVASFTITILDDTAPEADETIGVGLSNPVGAATLGTPSSAVVTIVDDDQPGALSFVTNVFFVNEAAGMALITVVRDSGGGSVSVNYATADGSARAGVDYTPASGTLSFGPGETSMTFAVPITLNPSVEGNETVILNLFNPSGGGSLGSPSSAVLVIVDDAVDRSGPLVTSSRVVAGPFGVAAVLVSFNEQVDPARAVDLLNYGYSVRTPGRDGRFGTRDDVLVGLCPATYDPATRTVRLPLAKAIAKKTQVQIQINQATSISGLDKGVADLAGNLLDGNADGVPGSPYSAVVAARPATAASVAVPVAHPAARAKAHPKKTAAVPVPGKVRAPSRPTSKAARSGP